MENIETILRSKVMKSLITFGILAALASLGAANHATAQQQGTTQPGQTPETIAPANINGGIAQNPWHANSEVQQHLNLTNQQNAQLNKIYNEQWIKYQKQLQVIPNNLTPEKRTQRINAARQYFYDNYNGASGVVFTNPQQGQRYNQLHWQYRNYGAFADPTVQQKLGFNEKQRLALTQHEQSWNKQIEDIRQLYQTDPAAAGKQFTALQQTTWQNINSVLTPQQQTTWRQIVGDPYNFQPLIYVPVVPNTSGPNNR
jgi:hypothetical protein